MRTGPSSHPAERRPVAPTAIGLGCEELAMEVFRDLLIRGEREQVAALMDDVEKSLPPGWVRNRVMEGQLRTLTMRTKPTYSFAHDRDNRFPSATIYITEKEPGLFFVPNIVPIKKHRLSYGESNALLEEFGERIVRPCAEKMGVHVELTACQADLRDWLSDKVAEKLRTFSMTASKNSGSVLPLDKEHWLDFIVTAHGEGSRLDPSTLRRWLIENEGWSPEIAGQLAGEYAFGGELLTFSQSRRAEADLHHELSWAVHEVTH
jgi:hypothetical protein